MLYVTHVLTSAFENYPEGTPVCNVLGGEYEKEVMPYRDNDWQFSIIVPISMLRPATPDESWISIEAACLDLDDELEKMVAENKVEVHPQDPKLCRLTLLMGGAYLSSRENLPH